MTVVRALTADDWAVVREVRDLPGHLHVVAMWVAPHARGRGVAHLVLGALRSWAEGRGLLLHLDVENANEPARRLYGGLRLPGHWYDERAA